MNEAKTISRLFKTIKDIAYGGTPFDDDAELKDALKEPLDKLIKFVDEWEKGNRLSIHVYNSEAAKIGTCKQIRQLGTCLAERLDKLEKKIKELEEKSNETWFIKEYKRYLNEGPWKREYYTHYYDDSPYYMNGPTCTASTTTKGAVPDRHAIRPKMGVPGTPTRAEEKEDVKPIEEVVRDAFGDGYVDQAPADAKADTRK
jgi:hypothetical protein